MKLLKITTTLLLLTTLGAAVAQTNPKPPIKPEIDPVRDQVEITRGAINLMVESLRNTSSSQGGYAHPDYERAAAEFHKRLGQALIQFEAGLERQILAPMSHLIKTYYRIKSAPSYSADERNALLNGLLEKINDLAKNKDKEYIQLIVDLIVAMDINVQEV